MKKRITAVAAFLAATAAVLPPAMASFGASAQVGATFSTATVAPVTQLTLTWACGVGIQRTAVLTWAASSSTFVTSYTVDRLDPASGAVLATATTATTAHTVAGIPKGTNVSFRVIANAHNWRSDPVTVTGTAPDKQKAC